MKLYDSAYLDGDVVRWKSNNAVPFAEDLEEMEVSPAIMAASQAARGADVRAFIKAYKKNYRGPSAEARAEMRAEFGEGTVMVNILTGKKFRV